ncbi:MAG: DegT/DnrJ/EryC1/StrS family aminotransferase [bacterium]|nr:DegT/DnrJ/EryC1/StrS family aminotransferase [bacterium]
MYFVHPQIKLKNALKAGFSLLKPSQEKKLKEKLGLYLPGKQLIFTDMAREAFKVIIKKANLSGTSMMLPAYICDIFYPILKHYNITPIFLDVDLRTFHIKISDIKNKITPDTKSILVCHTYGLPFDVDALRSDPALAGSDLVIIEDCAHNLLAGNAGDVSFFSLYKQVPSLRGGMLACPKDWQAELPETFFNFRDLLSLLNYFWPFAFFFKKFGSDYAKAHLRESKLTKPGGINRVSVNLFADFFDSFKNSSDRRRKLALLLRQELSSLGFEVQQSGDSPHFANVFCYLSALAPKHLTEKRDEIVQKLKKYRVFCTRIWHAPIILNPEVQKEYGLNPAEFPNTVEAAKRIINFPLQDHYSEKDVKNIIKAVKSVLSDL